MRQHRVPSTHDLAGYTSLREVLENDDRTSEVAHSGACQRAGKALTLAVPVWVMAMVGNQIERYLEHNRPQLMPHIMKGFPMVFLGTCAYVRVSLQRLPLSNDLRQEGHSMLFHVLRLSLTPLLFMWAIKNLLEQEAHLSQDEAIMATVGLWAVKVLFARAVDSHLLNELSHRPYAAVLAEMTWGVLMQLPLIGLLHWMPEERYIPEVTAIGATLFVLLNLLNLERLTEQSYTGIAYTMVDCCHSLGDFFSQSRRREPLLGVIGDEEAMMEQVISEEEKAQRSASPFSNR